MRQKHFAFDPRYTPLNHGSYGAFPTRVRDHQRALQDRIEACSDPCKYDLCTIYLARFATSLSIHTTLRGAFGRLASTFPGSSISNTVALHRLQAGCGEYSALRYQGTLSRFTKD